MTHFTDRPALPVLKPGFTGEATFAERSGTSYRLLPCRFLHLDGDRYLVTSMAGEYLVISRSHLDDLVHHRLSIHSKVYDELKSLHILSDTDSTVALDLLAIKYRTKQSLLRELTSLFMFVVTLRCEHSCPYCQVSRRSADRQAFDMSIEHANAALDLVFQSPSSRIKIEFQGGEPLLNFECIQHIVLKAKEMNAGHGKQLDFVIATNLALIDAEKLAFCALHRIAISTSLDGPASLHNQNRPRPGGDSYERAISGIHAAREALGHDQVAALMTTTHASLEMPEAIIDEYIHHGFESIFLRSLSPYGFAVKTGAVNRYDTDAWLAFYRRGLDYIVKRNLEGTPFREDYATLLLRKMLTPYPNGYVDLQSPAGIGISGMAFNYDGVVYASDEARMLAEMGDMRFKLGHVTSGRLAELLGADSYLEMLRQSMTEAMPMCSDCGIQPYCGSDPVYHHATQGDFIGRKPSSGHCQRTMGVVRYLVQLMEDDAKTRKVLHSWIR